MLLFFQMGLARQLQHCKDLKVHKARRSTRVPHALVSRTASQVADAESKPSLSKALTRFIREGAESGLWGDQITPNMMAPGCFWLCDGAG